MGNLRSLRGRHIQYDDYDLYVGGIPVRMVPRARGKGKTFFVEAAVDSNDGTSPDAGLGTLDEAFAKCTADRGDTIVVLPNHAETITGAGGITHDVAGVSVIGLGNYNQRPRFLMDGGTSVTYVISAADAYVDNLVFASGHLLITTCFNVTGVGAWINRCEFADNTTAENWATPVKATGAANTADGLKVTNCRWVPLIGAVNALEFVEITDDIVDLVIEDNFIVHEGTASPLVLQAGTKVMTRVSIQRNVLSHKMTAGDLAFDNGGAANSGIVADNYIGHADVTTTHTMGAIAGCRFFNNLSTSVDNLSGFVLPAIDTDG